MAKKNEPQEVAEPAAVTPSAPEPVAAPEPAAPPAKKEEPDPTVADIGAPIAGLPDVGRPTDSGFPMEIHEPSLDAYTKGLFRRASGDPEVFALAIMPNARDERTHFLKNNLHFINVTEEDFRLGFTEVKA